MSLAPCLGSPASYPSPGRLAWPRVRPTQPLARIVAPLAAAAVAGRLATGGSGWEPTDGRRSEKMVGGEHQDNAALNSDEAHGGASAVRRSTSRARLNCANHDEMQCNMC